MALPVRVALVLVEPNLAVVAVVPVMAAPRVRLVHSSRVAPVVLVLLPVVAVAVAATSAVVVAVATTTAAAPTVAVAVAVRLGPMQPTSHL